MRIRLSVPDELDDRERASALNAALEATTQVNEALVRKGKVPTAAEVIRSGAVRWQPEPPGDEHFDLAPVVIGRGWGDCDDLSSYYAGSLRASGTDPRARAFVKRSGPRRWHALVMRGSGAVEDPSIAAGMGHSVSGIGDAPAFQLPMTLDKKLAIAIKPTPDYWFTRVDAPDQAEPFAWSSVAAQPDPRASLLSALRTVRTVAGEDMDSDDQVRLGIVEDLVLGADPFDVAEALEELVGTEDAADMFIEGINSLDFLDHQVGSFGSFLKKIGRGIKSIGKIVLPIAGSIVPGLGNAAGAAAAMLLDKIPMGEKQDAERKARAQGLLQQAIALKAQRDQQRAAQAAQPMPQAPPPQARPFGAALPRAQFPTGPARGGMPFGGMPFGGGGMPFGGMPFGGFGGMMFNPFAQFDPFAQLQHARPATFMFERGSTVRPWGADGPSVMRF